MDTPIDLGSFEFPQDEPQLSLVRQSGASGLDVFSNPYLTPYLSDEQQEVIENRELAEHTIREKGILGEGAMHTLGDLYLAANIEFVQATGQTFALRDSIEHKEHQTLYSAFLKLMNNELGYGLVENYRMAKSEITRIAATDISPKAKPEKPPETRRPTFAEWFLGREVAIDEE